MFRPSRRRHGPDPTLRYRMLLFGVGAVAGLFGMATERSWLVLTGTVFLAIGLVVAIVANRKRLREGEQADTDGEEDAT
ncbi:MAG: hypothetical protein ACREL7_05830 [Longimicrobiales bacterium]